MFFWRKMFLRQWMSLADNPGPTSHPGALSQRKILFLMPLCEKWSSRVWWRLQHSLDIPFVPSQIRWVHASDPMKCVWKWYVTSGLQHEKPYKCDSQFPLSLQWQVRKACVPEEQLQDGWASVGLFPWGTMWSRASHSLTWRMVPKYD